MKKYLKVMFSILILLILIVICLYVYPVIHYGFHQIKIRETLSENEYHEIPFTYGSNNHFQINCSINDVKKNLLIDTKATGLLREDSILKMGGEYWGKLPFCSSNAYGIKERMDIYSFNNICLENIKIKYPLFSCVKRSNLIYDAIEDGVWGSDLLAIGCWKFDTENKMLKLFHYNNQQILEKESNGLVKIKGGLEDNGITVYVNEIKQNCRFTLDLGYSGTIEVDNRTADLLMSKINYKQIYSILDNGMRDTVTIFEDVQVSIAGINVEKCQVANIRSVNRNYIGAKFMQNFNFILIYGEEKGHLCKHLYLQKRAKGTLNFQCQYRISKYGMKIERKNGNFILTSLMKNSKAEQIGLRIGDQIIKINDLSEEFIDDMMLDSLNQLKITVKNRGEFKLSM